MRLWSEYGATRILPILIGTCAIIVLGGILMYVLPYGRITYSTLVEDLATSRENTALVVTHVRTPQSLGLSKHWCWYFVLL